MAPIDQDVRRAGNLAQAVRVAGLDDDALFRRTGLAWLNHRARVTGSMRALKVLVVIMGVLLVGGTAALVVAVIERARQHLAQPAAAPPGRGFGRAIVDLPAGARVIAVEPAGERLVVRIGLAEGGEALILIDARTGAKLGTIELRPGETGAMKP
jgi:hypothetical protein